MARIISLDRIHKDIRVNSSIVADYDMDHLFFLFGRINKVI